jgi:hypothetical protein
VIKALEDWASASVGLRVMVIALMVWVRERH